MHSRISLCHGAQHGESPGVPQPEQASGTLSTEVGAAVDHVSAREEPPHRTLTGLAKVPSESPHRLAPHGKTGIASSVAHTQAAPSEARISCALTLRSGSDMNALQT